MTVSCEVTARGYRFIAHMEAMYMWTAPWMCIWLCDSPCKQSPKAKYLFHRWPSRRLFLIVQPCYSLLNYFSYKFIIHIINLYKCFHQCFFIHVWLFHLHWLSIINLCKCFHQIILIHCWIFYLYWLSRHSSQSEIIIYYLGELF